MAAVSNPYYPAAPAAPTPYVNDFDIQASQAARRRKMAELLQAQAMQSPQSVNPGVPMSLAQPLAKLFAAWVAKGELDNADQSESDLQKQRTAAFNDVLNRMPTAQANPTPSGALSGMDGSNGTDMLPRPVTPQDTIRWAAELGQTGALGAKIGEQVIAGALKQQAGTGKWQNEEMIDPTTGLKRRVLRNTLDPDPSHVIPLGGVESTTDTRAFNQAQQLALLEQKKQTGTPLTADEERTYAALSLVRNANVVTPNPLTGGGSVTNRVPGFTVPPNAPAPNMLPPPPGAQPPAQPQPPLMPNVTSAAYAPPPAPRGNGYGVLGQAKDANGTPLNVNFEGRTPEEVQQMIASAQQDRAAMGAPSVASVPSAGPLPAGQPTPPSNGQAGQPGDDRPLGPGMMKNGPTTTYAGTMPLDLEHVGYSATNGQDVMRDRKSGQPYILNGVDARNNPQVVRYMGAVLPKEAAEKDYGALRDLYSNATQYEKLADQVKANPGAFSFRADVGANLPFVGGLQSVTGMSPQEQLLRQSVMRDFAEETKRLYGASFTEGEQKRANSFIVKWNDPPEVVESKIRGAAQFARDMSAKYSPGIAGLYQRRHGAAGQDRPATSSSAVDYNALTE